MQIIISEPEDYHNISIVDCNSVRQISYYHLTDMVLAHSCDNGEIFRNCNDVKVACFSPDETKDICALKKSIGNSCTLSDCSVLYYAQLCGLEIVTNQEFMLKVASQFKLNAILTSD